MTKNLFLTRLQEEVLIYVSISDLLEREIWLKANLPYARFNLENCNIILGLCRDFIKAGTDILVANTIRANRAQLQQHGMENQVREINWRGIEIAHQASEGRVLVAGGIGPTGIFADGDQAFENVLDLFREQIVALKEGRPDLLLIKNIANIREMKAALIACRELFDGPVIAEVLLETDQTDTPDELALLTILTPFQPDVIGVACASPTCVIERLEKMAVSHIPLVIALSDIGPTAPPIAPALAGKLAVQWAEKGASVIGGPATPEQVCEMALQLNHRQPAARPSRRLTSLASPTQILPVDGNHRTVFMGNRLDITANPDLMPFLALGNSAPLLIEAKKQIQAGAAIIVVNLAVHGFDETRVTAQIVNEIEKMGAVVICLHSANAEVVEAGLQNFAGKGVVWLGENNEPALIRILPLVKKYGAAGIIPLHLSEIQPNLTLNPFDILEDRLALCRELNFDLDDIWIDCSIAPGENLPEALPTAIKMIRKAKHEFGLKTVFSFHPQQLNQSVQNTFWSIALTSGLDVPVLNPLDLSVLKTISATDLFLGRNRIPDLNYPENVDLSRLMQYESIN